MLEPGREVSHYRLVEKLGEGGMGVVWRAVDTSLDREVAIKTLPPGLTLDEQRRARFVREAKLLAALNHPHIAGIHQVEESDGTQLLVMELIEGETLAERLARGQPSLDETLRIALQMTLALEEAHERGIVHRDLKPANVKITPSGTVKVLDFGLAKALEAETGEPGSQPSLSHSPTLTAEMTSAGVLLGTAAYMSPEQARGEPADRRADIWAFGIVLMEMLSGRTVYAAKTAADTLAGVLAREPDWDDLPRRTPPSVRRLVERCLVKDPRDRLQAIGEARLIIEAYLADPDADAEAPVASGRRAAVPWAVAGVLGAALAASLIAAWIGDDPAPPRSTARVSLELPPKESLFVGYGAAAILSPDGTRLVYGTGSGSHRELHARSLDQWEGTLLHEGDDAGRPYQPFFSPDGAWVGFVTPGELKKMPASGGTPIVLCDVEYARGASWGEDGTIVLAPSPRGGLVRVSEAGGEPQPLTELDAERGEVSHRWPQILPGGRAILFTAHTATSGFDDASIELLLVDGGERRTLHRGGTYARYSPSGHVLFVREDTLFAMPFDAERLEVDGSAVPIVGTVRSDPREGSAQFSLSDTGTLAYLSGTSAPPRLLPVWADRTGRTRPLWDEWQNYKNPRVSPDGRRVALEVERDGQWDIWIFDVEREVPTRLTFSAEDDHWAAWAPDGRSIVFLSRRDDEANIYRKASDGSGDVERLTDSEFSQYPGSISPDGTTLALTQTSEASNFDLWLLPLDGSGEARPFLATPFAEVMPAFSPDGRWIAYFSSESGAWEVYVRPVSGPGKWQISSAGGAWPIWSPDGRELYFWNDAVIHAVSVETGGSVFRAGRPTVLYEGVLSDLGQNRPWDIAPDGTFVALKPESVGTDQHEHVRLVLDWFDELERAFRRPAP